MFFERPLFLLLLLLTLPWMYWLRRQEPPEFAVGGLGPFRAFARIGGARRRGWPLALLCAVAALLCAALALARPHLTGTPEYLLLDRSLSVQFCGLSAPSGNGRITLEFENDPLSLLRALPERSSVEVWTDLPAPADLPARVHWNNAAFRPFSAPNAAILVARPIAERRWAVHWLAEPGAGALILATDATDRVDLSATDREGVTEISVSAAASILEIRRADGTSDARLDNSWSLNSRAWLIPEQWDSRWESVAAAAWPGFQIRRAAQVANPPWSADPLTTLSDLDAVAFLAEQLRAEADRAQAPRPASECRAPPSTGRWQKSRGDSGASEQPGFVWLGVFGALLLLLSFFFGRSGSLSIPRSSEVG